MPNSDPLDRYVYPVHKLMIDSYNNPLYLLPLMLGIHNSTAISTFIKNSTKKSEITCFTVRSTFRTI